MTDEELKRIKIFNGDARTILPNFKTNTFEKIFILFPDPWPKKRHHKRRIIQNLFLNELSRVMSLKGELRIASDDYSYICWIMYCILENDHLVWKVKSINDILELPNDLIKTKYQQKADILKKQSYYFKLLKEN